MRIKEHEKEAIINAIKTADPNARIWLFGSRADDNKKGGDIDIAIFSSIIHNNTMQIINIKRSIFNKIGEQKIDIITTKDGKEAIFKLAMEDGIELKEIESLNNNLIEVLKSNLSALNSSLNRLMYSYNLCRKIGIKYEYSEEEFVEFEAMTSRYARTTDMLINKVLRSLDSVEYLDSGTIIDIMNQAEKRGIANSLELRNLKDLRNYISHEYVTENIIRFFDDVIKSTPILNSIIANVNKYCEKYLNKNDC